MPFRTSTMQEQSAVQTMKKFSKVRLFESIGFLNRRFNHETMEFERSWSLIFYSQLVLWMKVTALLR